MQSRNPYFAQLHLYQGKCPHHKVQLKLFISNNLCSSLLIESIVNQLLRLGKREQVPIGDKMLELKYNKALCSDENGVNCIRFPEELVDGSARKEVPLLALYSTIIRGISAGDGDLRMSPSIVEAPLISSGESINGPSSLDFLDMMTQQLKRAHRSASDRTLQDMINSSPVFGAKRVAFTPRIGRRR